jgi:hypothetical protein
MARLAICTDLSRNACHTCAVRLTPAAARLAATLMLCACAERSRWHRPCAACGTRDPAHPRSLRCGGALRHCGLAASASLASGAAGAVGNDLPANGREDLAGPQGRTDDGLIRTRRATTRGAPAPAAARSAGSTVQEARCALTDDTATVPYASGAKARRVRSSCDPVVECRARGSRHGEPRIDEGREAEPSEAGGVREERAYPTDLRGDRLLNQPGASSRPSRTSDKRRSLPRDTSGTWASSCSPSRLRGMTGETYSADRDRTRLLPCDTCSRQGQSAP